MRFFSWPRPRTARRVAFYHDVEQDIDSRADAEQCRCMVKEFLRLEKAYSVPATYNVVGRLFREQPDLIDVIRSAGQELAFHSYHHQPDWQPRYYAKEVKLCRDASREPQGYRSPRSDWDRTTLRACWEQGLAWNAEADRHGAPYFIYGKLVRIPIAGDDWPLHTGGLGPAEWVERFARLLQRRPFVAFGCHDSVASFAPQERLGAWEKVLHRARSEGALLLTFSAAAERCRRGEF